MILFLKALTKRTYELNAEFPWIAYRRGPPKIVRMRH